jgi:hypothetical protein
MGEGRSPSNISLPSPSMEREPEGEDEMGYLFIKVMISCNMKN